MLKKTIKYVDYDGNEREEDFWFNISKAEAREWELGDNISALLAKIAQTQDRKALIDYFKEFILKAYGEKSLDGKYFRKSPELSLAFTQTEAYTELYMELTSNTDAAIAFINGILPKVEEIEKAN